MTNVKTLAAAVFALASFPLLAQQAGSPAGSQDQQPNGSPPAAQAQPQPTQPQSAPTSSAMAAVELAPVNGELVDKLDTKTAKTGDGVVIKTKSSVKTADGTEIPKGSKLMGHITAVKSSAQGAQGNDNSQVALQFDRVELKGGQNLAIHSEIQSLSPSGSDNPGSAPDTMAAAPNGTSGSTSSPAPGSAASGGSMNGPSSSAAPSQPQSQTNGGSPAVSPAGPAAGTIVARNGNIAIRTTSIPGVLLANNEPGQQDPRMAQSSGILLGAKRDVQLDGGTNVVIGVAAASGTTPGAN